MARKLGTSRARKAGVFEAVLVGVLLLGVIISHAELKKRQRRQAEHIANVAASVEREEQALLEAMSARTKQQSPSGWLCDREPCNEGDLHLDRPPPETEHLRDPVPIEPPTKPVSPPGGPTRR